MMVSIVIPTKNNASKINFKMRVSTRRGSYFSRIVEYSAECCLRDQATIEEHPIPWHAKGF